MCGRFVMLTVEEVEAVVQAVQARMDGAAGGEGEALIENVAESGGTPRRQAYPGTEVLLIGPEFPGGRKLEAESAVWGFDPEWGGKLVFNTRIESMIGGSPMWREIAQDGRCVVPAAAFFEPHATETVASPRTGRPIKRAYQFSDPEGAPVLLAGVRAAGRCSVVTCEPNRWVAPVHPRMPLVLRFEEVPAWLEGDWQSLADRRDARLAAAPEFPDIQPNPEQLSLF